MIEVVELATDEQRATAVSLARRIWMQYYPGIISFAQIHYMLERGYRVDVIASEQASGIEWYMASVHDEPLGLTAFGRSGPDVKVHKIYVDRQARGTGMGRTLMAVAEQRARLQGAEALVLTVNIGNLDSVRAYLAMGFAFAGRMAMPIGHGFVMDDYVMRKPL